MYKIPVSDSIRKDNSLLSIILIAVKPGQNFSCDTSRFECQKQSSMPNSIKSFAEVTEDNTDLFATESVIKICKLIGSRVSWYETRL